MGRHITEKEKRMEDKMKLDDILSHVKTENIDDK